MQPWAGRPALGGWSWRALGSPLATARPWSAFGPSLTLCCSEASVKDVETIQVPNPLLHPSLTSCSRLQFTKLWVGKEGSHRPRAFFWVEAGWKGCWKLHVPQGPPEGFVWDAGSRKLPTLGKFLPTRGWAWPPLPLQRETPRLIAWQPVGSGHGEAGSSLPQTQFPLLATSGRC